MSGAESRRRRLVGPCCTLVLSALLAACGATIPESGPIVEGPVVGAGSDNQVIRVIARPPTPGATPVEIVNGFLEASASYDDDYAIAREYLTAGASVGWDPGVETRIYDGAGVKVEPDGFDRVTFSAPLLGRIDGEGSYLVADAGETGRSDFRLVLDSGEWRIISVPTGLLLSRGDVERSYRTVNLYFLDPQFTTLVPDPISVPNSGSGLATTLVRRLLEGPTEWLAPAVRTAVPNGVSLAIDSVPVVNGVAEISLDPRVLTTDQSTRAAMSAQIVWTLRQVPEVTGVSITAGGVSLAVPGQPSVQSRDSWPAYDPNAMTPNTAPLALSARGVVQVEAAYSAPVAGAAGRSDQPLSTLAVALDEQRVAGFDKERVTLLEAPLIDGGAFRVRAQGAGMASASFGPDGALWWVESKGVRTISATSNTVQPVAVEGIGTGRVVGIAIARDGTRAALLIRRGPQVELNLVRIERRGDSLRLTAPRRVEARISSTVDVAWASADQLAVLGTEGAGPLEVFTVRIGAQSVRSVVAPAKSVTVAAAPVSTMLAGVSDGSVLAYDALAWQQLMTGWSPAYPG
ncbi:MAG: hypothetical protein F2842_00485 [Actinobacteria bacterium]|uniref:Unannotated protein n=1 Tax=freshwater metagenome TaxID=449393 RepID=A0A6J7IDR1_9ZZZZ|nr:hypothetical protein [Actinomycetota bacterium]